MEQRPDEPDVAILGGGLAGLTLALQLTRRRPATTVFVAEKRDGPAPEAAFKVGESTVEYACHYFGTVCGLQDHLDGEQLLKSGLRFFLPAGDNTDITRRFEWGQSGHVPVPTYQLDRGRFENELARRVLAAGVDLRGATTVEQVELGRERHVVAVSRACVPEEIRPRWVVDCTGRAFTLKRNLGLEAPSAHTINSSWFRLGGGLVDLEDWGAHDADWLARTDEPGFRKYATNHLMGEGYWVWLIPLASGSHSIGIVADPRFHPFARIATFEAALDWLREHEPQLAATVADRRGDVQDFLRVEDFSYGARQVYSADRWCLTGEAGVFIDPYYSPGSDFIAIANSHATELITRELDGEDVGELAAYFNDALLQGFERRLSAVWTDKYELFGDAEVIAAKTTCDYLVYWGVTALPQCQDRSNDPAFMQSLGPDLARQGALARAIYPLLRDWHALSDGAPNPTGRFADLNRCPALMDRNADLVGDWDDDALRRRVAANVDILEGLAVVLLHKAVGRLPDVTLDPEARIDPQAVSLHPDRWDEDRLFADDGLTLAEARARVPGVENMLLDEIGVS